jgi:hypothetical protein
MKQWSRFLALEAVVCAGFHTLCAPLLLFSILVPMDFWSATLVFTAAVLAATALLIYWRLALATIEQRSFHFGYPFWCGVASTLSLMVIASFAKKPLFWLLVVTPPVISGLHFSYLQYMRSRTFRK